MVEPTHLISIWTSNWIMKPQIRGENSKNIWNHQPRYIPNGNKSWKTTLDPTIHVGSFGSSSHTTMVGSGGELDPGRNWIPPGKDRWLGPPPPISLGWSWGPRKQVSPPNLGVARYFSIFHYSVTSWWLNQPIWNILTLSNWIISPSRGETRNIWYPPW